METTSTVQRKWTSTAGPRQTKAVSEALGKISWESNTYVELTGIIGGPERSAVLTSICGAGRADCGEALQRIAEKFDCTVTSENCHAIVAECERELEALKENRPVKDRRETAEVVAEREAKCRAREEERRARDERWRAIFCKPEPISVPSGQMAVLAHLCYNNSDSLTDYFDPHASIGDRILLGSLPKGPQTEAKARYVLSRYPELAALTWKWHTENYSLGRGNYLSSTSVELTPEQANGVQARGGGPIQRGHWLIDFDKYPRGLYYAHRDYPGAASDPVVASSVPGIIANGATITENLAKNGVEIRFDAKPEQAVLERLKAHGWRWSRFSQCWYVRRTDEALAFAKELVGARVEPVQAAA